MACWARHIAGHVPPPPRGPLMGQEEEAVTKKSGVGPRSGRWRYMTRRGGVRKMLWTSCP